MPARCTRVISQHEIIRDTLVTRDGEVVNYRVREFFALPALVPQAGD